MTSSEELPYAYLVTTKSVSLRDRLLAVKAMLVSRGEKLKDWTRRAGVSRQAVDQYISNRGTREGGRPREISYENVLRLADAADVDRAWLLHGVDAIPRSVTGGKAERIESLRRELDALLSTPETLRVMPPPRATHTEVREMTRELAAKERGKSVAPSHRKRLSK